MSFDLLQAGGRSILFIMAVDAEYGPHLRQRIRPLMTGVGPVEAAVTLTHALSRLQAAAGLPNLVVSLGSAGSRILEQTEIYQVYSVAYRDMDASPLGFDKGRTPFLAHPAVIELSHRIPGISAASLSTGGNIVSGAAYDRIDADMVDMETFAALRSCQFFGLPLIGLRGISDGQEELRHVGDWTEYLHGIDEKRAAAGDHLLDALAEGELHL